MCVLLLQHKKAGTKGELKAVDYVEQQEKKHHEWSNKATTYLKVISDYKKAVVAYIFTIDRTIRLWMNIDGL